jgi:hypothetical protein
MHKFQATDCVGGVGGLHGAAVDHSKNRINKKAECII